MNQETPVWTRNSGDLDAPARALPAAPGTPDAAHPGLAAFLHRHLRGRYLLAAVLSLSGAVLGAVGGYMTGTPRFRAEGLIRVQPVLPRALYQSEESALQPMFSSFVNTQANLISNSRVISQAMSSREWRDLPPAATGITEEDEFRKRLLVTTSRDAPELIFVSFSHQQAKTAFIALKALITAYEDLFATSETKAVRKLQVESLTAKKTTLDNERKSLETRLASLASEFETFDLVRLSDHYLSQLVAFDDRLNQLIIRLTDAGIDPAKITEKDLPTEKADDPEEHPADAAPGMTAEQIAVIDKAMSDKIAERDEVARKLDRMKATGLTPQHRQVQLAERQLSIIKEDIKARVETWVPPPKGAARADVPDALLDRDSLIERFLRFKREADKWRSRTEAVGRAKIQYESLVREAKSNQELLDEVNKRIDEISVESKLQDAVGRIEVILPDIPPASPKDDPRRKLAAVGLIGGGALPLLVVIGLGMLDRRLRYADQAGVHDGAVPLLGILPQLPKNPADPNSLEQTANAVYCVHHIRSRLLIGGETVRTLAVTSPTSGDGKTSLTLALALSYASAHYRTLLVDFDLIGRSLSRQAGVSVDDGLGAYLVRPEGPPPIRPTKFPQLSIIPAGRNDALNHARVSHGALEALLTRLRGEYDIILVDTGPILGSLEATVAASVVDGIVLVVGRGQDSSRVGMTLRQLGALGAKVKGIVFNRAHVAEFNRSTLISTSLRSVGPDSPPRLPRTPPAPRSDLDDLNPLARGMLGDGPSEDAQP